VPALEEELQLGREVRNAIGRLQHRLCPRKANRFVVSVDPGIVVRTKMCGR
jgi:hypothetical protein